MTMCVSDHSRGFLLAVSKAFLITNTGERVVFARAVARLTAMLNG